MPIQIVMRKWAMDIMNEMQLKFLMIIFGTLGLAYAGIEWFAVCKLVYLKYYGEAAAFEAYKTLTLNCWWHHIGSLCVAIGLFALAWLFRMELKRRQKIQTVVVEMKPVEGGGYVGKTKL